MISLVSTFKMRRHASILPFTFFFLPFNRPLAILLSFALAIRDLRPPLLSLFLISVIGRTFLFTPSRAPWSPVVVVVQNSSPPDPPSQRIAEGDPFRLRFSERLFVICGDVIPRGRLCTQLPKAPPFFSSVTTFLTRTRGERGFFPRLGAEVSASSRGVRFPQIALFSVFLHRRDQTQ